ncbi:MAG: hypothetical protein M5U09_09610 [Gammaproteobacteria bacterium]|nr:hypothetical protein [Gammaproteobacteria bacterium]
MRAIGGGGAVAPAVLGACWQRPVIDSVLLPAHAQTTEEMASSAPGVRGCVVTLAYTFQPSTGSIPGPNPTGQFQTYHLIAADWNGAAFVNERTIAEATHDGSQPVSLSGTAVMAEGAEGLGLGHRRTLNPDPANVHFTHSIECCDGGTAGDSGGYLDGGSTGGGPSNAAFVEFTDGSCTFNV